MLACGSLNYKLSPLLSEEIFYYTLYIYLEQKSKGTKENFKKETSIGTV